MPSVAILGGSVTGSVAALLFARAGWSAHVVDPEFDRFADAHASVEPRAGAPQTAQPHGLMSRAYVELATRVPDVVSALLESGVPLTPLSEMVPPELYDGGRPGDEQLSTLRTRRVTLDAVLHRIVGREPGVTLHRTKATGLLTEPGAPPRAVGLGLAGGEIVRADLILDAGGRRSPVTRWLAEAGYEQPEQVDPCGVNYYGRHFRVGPGPRPRLNTGFGDIHDFPTHLQLMFLGDNDTAMVALCVHRGDPAMKRLRDADAFTEVLTANEAFGPWLERLEPMTPVFALGALNNRMRSLVTHGQPVLVGLHQAGDALMMTNPTRGRGIAMGLAAAGRLCDLATANGGADEDLTLQYGRWQQEVLSVYYREAAASDAALDARMLAHLRGTAVPGNAPRVLLPEGHPVSSTQVEQAATADPDLLRLLLRAHHVLDDERQIASPDTADSVRRVLAPKPPG
ncbi:MAG TPA: hypothetical protein VHC49_09285 [Mycobacteriales bacterium]|nr:hypothetical protein [Mycobacteriales bacterium]